VLFAGVGALGLAPLMIAFSPIARMRELSKHEAQATESAAEELV